MLVASRMVKVRLQKKYVNTNISEIINTQLKCTVIPVKMVHNLTNVFRFVIYIPLSTHKSCKCQASTKVLKYD